MNHNEALILIVEDDEMTQIMTKAILEMSGYQTENAYNGLECIDLLEKGLRPETILMDVMMPLMNGVEALKTIKKNRKFSSIPIIFLTALNDIEIIKECFEEGATDFIMKPFKNIELLARIGSTVTTYRKNKDINDRKNILEKQNKEITRKIYRFETQNNELKKLDETKDYFIGAVTHDFKSPLTGIRSIAEMMIQENITDPKLFPEYLNFIISQVDIINRMIVQTLQSIKKIPEIAQIKPKKINIKTFFESICYDLTLIAKSHGINFTYKYNTSLTHIEIDTDKMNDLLNNIFFNSIKYANGTDICLTTSNDDWIFYIVIEDHGNGFPKGEEDKIFTRFYRGDETSPIDGEGLGLFISKKIALAHNGNIRAENREEGGARFTISLPINFNTL